MTIYKKWHRTLINLLISNCRRKTASKFSRIHSKALSHIHHKIFFIFYFSHFTEFVLCIFLPARKVKTSYASNVPYPYFFYYFFFFFNTLPYLNSRSVIFFTCSPNSVAVLSLSFSHYSCYFHIILNIFFTPSFCAPNITFFVVYHKIKLKCENFYYFII